MRGPRLFFFSEQAFWIPTHPHCTIKPNQSCPLYLAANEILAVTAVLLGKGLTQFNLYLSNSFFFSFFFNLCVFNNVFSLSGHSSAQSCQQQRKYWHHTVSRAHVGYRQGQGHGGGCDFVKCMKMKCFFT